MIGLSEAIDTLWICRLECIRACARDDLEEGQRIIYDLREIGEWNRGIGARVDVCVMLFAKLAGRWRIREICPLLVPISLFIVNRSIGVSGFLN